jgi:hypothetical protein
MPTRTRDDDEEGEEELEEKHGVLLLSTLTTEPSHHVRSIGMKICSCSFFFQIEFFFALMELRGTVAT